MSVPEPIPSVNETEYERCPKCKGLGYRIERAELVRVMMGSGAMNIIPCERCHGDGTVAKKAPKMFSDEWYRQLVGGADGRS